MTFSFVIVSGIHYLIFAGTNYTCFIGTFDCKSSTSMGIVNNIH